MKPTFTELDKSFKTARSLHELEMLLDRYFAALGITLFSFTYYSYHPNSLHKLKYSYSSSGYDLWHKHFIEEGYDDIDTTLDSVYQSVLPILWDTVTQLKEARSPREKQMRKDSIEFGVQKGVSIPIHGPFEDFAILTLTQKSDQTCLEKFSTIQHELFSVAYYFYSYLQRLLLKDFKPDSFIKINKRDMQILHLLAKQYTTGNIAKELHITERTVNYHIQRLNKKLGVSNKYQAVIKALQKGLIHF